MVTSMLETKCVGDGFGHFSHQHSSSLNTNLVPGTNIQKMSPRSLSVANILQLSPTVSHQHLNVTNMTVAPFWSTFETIYRTVNAGWAIMTKKWIKTEILIHFEMTHLNCGSPTWAKSVQKFHPAWLSHQVEHFQWLLEKCSMIFLHSHHQ